MPSASSTAEPIAIIGMSALYPGATTIDAFRELLARGACAIGEVPEARWRHDDVYDPDPAAVDATTARVGGFIDDPDISLARYRIPPAHATSIARAQLLYLEAVDRCLIDAGYDRRAFDRDRTDVVCGSCFGFDRTYANALRVEAARYIARYVDALGELAAGERAAIVADLRERFRRRLGGAAHDRIGEMASTIPARISVAYGLRGRSLAVESADVTAFVALRAAVDALRDGTADQVILVVGQVLDSPLAHVAFAKKGLLATGRAAPLSATATGYTLGEGIGAMLLKRRGDAVRDGDRVYALVRAVALAHASRPGSFRYDASSETRAGAIASACREAACPPRSLQYVDCVASALPGETDLELAALGAALAGEAPPGAVAIGSVKGNVGHTFANTGMAALTRVALGLHDRVLYPHAATPGAPPLHLAGTPFAIVDEARAWPAGPGGGPRRAGVDGASVTGTVAHAILEEHVPGAPAPAIEVREPVAIAVVGLGGRFARADSAAALWDNLRGGVDVVAPLPDDVVERDVYHAPESLDVFTTYSVLGSKVAPAEPPRVVPRRLLYMDEAQRLALAVARETLASIGRPPPGERAAVVLGTMLALGSERAASNRLQHGVLEDVLVETPSFRQLGRIAQRHVLDGLRRVTRDAVPPVSSWSLDGYLASGVAAVVSNELGLDAVPIVVEAACASSLAAIDVAVRALAAGRHDLVLAGGIDLPANARDLVLCSSLRLLSQGRIKPFDAEADGINIGEGAAMFALMRLDDAVKHGCRVRAVLRGMGGSSDARSLIAPDAEGQALAIRRAFAAVDFGPDAIDYVEAHGTGTRAGDRAELRALASVYAPREAPLAVGSIKSALGHTFAAAGAAGLMKTVLALEHDLIPPNLHLRRIDPDLGLDAIPARVVTAPEPWPRRAGRPRRAAVSAMGTGGINFHLLVEEGP